jgi:DNA repair protein RadC
MEIINWQDVYRGDSALVISDNKLGLVIKPYGRKFHLLFPDGTEKTYDATELKFFKFDDEYANGGTIKNPYEEYLLSNGFEKAHEVKKYGFTEYRKGKWYASINTKTKEVEVGKYEEDYSYSDVKKYGGIRENDSPHYHTDKYTNSLNNFKKFLDNNYILEYAKGGVTYKDLSKEKPLIINESNSDIQSKTFKVEELDLYRKGKKSFQGNPQITNSESAVKIFRQFWDEEALSISEHMNVMLLNRANKVIGLYQHSKGGVAGTILEPEMIVLAAVKSLAKGVIIAHNHPSGNLRPSDADEVLSNNLKKALKLVDINLLDSLIITEDGFYSFTDEGKFANGGITKPKKRKRFVTNLDDGFMADGGDVEDEDEGLNYNSISDLEDELRRLIRWSNQYGSKGADGQINQLRKRIEYLKKGPEMADGGYMAKGGHIKEGDKFGDYSVTFYEPITYDNLGGSFGGYVRLVNQEDLDMILIQYDHNLRGGEWFVSKNKIQYVGKNPKEVIEKLRRSKQI